MSRNTQKCLNRADPEFQGKQLDRLHGLTPWRPLMKRLRPAPDARRLGSIQRMPEAWVEGGPTPGASSLDPRTALGCGHMLGLRAGVLGIVEAVIPGSRLPRSSAGSRQPARVSTPLAGITAPLPPPHIPREL